MQGGREKEKKDLIESAAGGGSWRPFTKKRILNDRSAVSIAKKSNAVRIKEREEKRQKIIRKTSRQRESIRYRELASVSGESLEEGWRRRSPFSKDQNFSETGSSHAHRGRRSGLDLIANGLSRAILPSSDCFRGSDIVLYEEGRGRVVSSRVAVLESSGSYLARFFLRRSQSTRSGYRA